VLGQSFLSYNMNSASFPTQSAPFRTQSAPPTRAFGGAGGLSFAERAAAFRSTSEPTALTASISATATNTTSSSVAVEVKAPVDKPTFGKAPKLSAAAQAAYVPKNSRTTADAKVIPTADMFPALPSKARLRDQFQKADLCGHHEEAHSTRCD